MKRIFLSVKMWCLAAVSKLTHPCTARSNITMGNYSTAYLLNCHITRRRVRRRAGEAAPGGRPRKPFTQTLNKVPQEFFQLSAKEEWRWWTGRTKWGKGNTIQEGRQVQSLCMHVHMCACRSVFTGHVNQQENEAAVTWLPGRSLYPVTQNVCVHVCLCVSLEVQFKVWRAWRGEKLKSSHGQRQEKLMSPF